MTTFWPTDEEGWTWECDAKVRTEEDSTGSTMTQLAQQRFKCHSLGTSHISYPRRSAKHFRDYKCQDLARFTDELQRNADRGLLMSRRGMLTEVYITE